MSEQLVKRLRELSEAAARGDWNEFSLRVPAEKDRDADFVLLQAADKIAALEADAARYRWLRAQDDSCSIQVLQGISWEKPAMCCALTFLSETDVDAAMQAKP